MEFEFELELRIDYKIEVQIKIDMEIKEYLLLTTQPRFWVLVATACSLVYGAIFKSTANHTQRLKL